jgi:hypothetical protein
MRERFFLRGHVDGLSTFGLIVPAGEMEMQGNPDKMSNRGKLRRLIIPHPDGLVAAGSTSLHLQARLATLLARNA